MIAFAQPSGALALAAIAVLVVLLRLRRRARPVPVPSLLLWQRLPSRPIERRHPRPDLPFWLQAAAAAALALGLMRPWLRDDGPGAAGEPLVLVIDCSASMAARETGGTRLALARARAESALRALAGDAPAMLIAAETHPRVLARWTADRDALRAAIAALEPRDVPGRLAAAVERATSEARARAGARVLVLTDVSPERSGVSAATRAAVDWVALGTPRDNLAIVTLDVDQPPFTEPAGATITATVANLGTTPRDVTIVASIGDQSWLRRALHLDAGARVPVLLSGPPRAGLLAIALEHDGDALAADDRALGWIAPAPSLDTVVVTDGDAAASGVVALARALAGPRVEVVNRAGWRERGATAGQLALFDRTVPLEDDAPVAGAALYVAPPPGNPICPARRTVDDVAVVDWDEEHPLLAGLSGLEALGVTHAVVLDVPAWGRAIVRAASDRVAFPLLVVGERRGRRIACLAAELPVPLAASDALPLLVLGASTLGWLTEATSGAPIVVHTGIPRRAALAGAADDGALRVRPAAGVFVAGRVGQHHAVAPDGSPRLVLASLLDEAESDLAGPGGEWHATAAPTRVQPAPTAAGRRLDGWCWALALAVLAAEWGVWRRRT